MAILELNHDNFESTTSNNRPVLIDFNADWCGPCKMQEPILEEIAEENEDYIVASVNIDDEPELAEEYAVSGIPCLIFFKDGEEKKRAIGLHPKKAILKILEKLS